MMSKAGKGNSRGSVRIGPISLIVLVIVICLAVMAMLTAAMEHTMSASASRQAQFTQSTYLNESVAQELVAGVDAVSDRDIQAIQGTISESTAKALERGVSIDAHVDENTVSATFTTENGRCLDVQFAYDKSGITIKQWKASTVWAEDGDGQLWDGGATRGG